MLEIKYLFIFNIYLILLRLVRKMIWQVASCKCFDFIIRCYTIIHYYYYILLWLVWTDMGKMREHHILYSLALWKVVIIPSAYEDSIMVELV